MTIIGIDLGTTNSAVSVWREGRSLLIPNALGDKLTPSVVGVDDNGDILVGRIAQERLLTHPLLTAGAFKRHMGTAKEIRLGDRRFRPEELSALVLRALKADAESYLGEPVTEAVISVPAYFNDTQRKATRMAGELAGLQVERLLNEPTAAAIAYGLHQQRPETQFLVFDLGGGTFDVSILELFDGVMEVKAIAGDNYLGGEDFTNAIVEHFLNAFGTQSSELERKTLAFLRDQAEAGKRNLSRRQPIVMRAGIGGETKELRIDRDRFEQLVQPLVDRLRRPIERALLDASIDAASIDEIVMVGGASRMPVVYSMLSRMFGRLPAANIDPDETVAAGAGVQAGMKERSEELQDIVMTDVCPYTLGTEVAISHTTGEYEGGHFSPIIDRNTFVPVSRVKRFSTMNEEQRKIIVKIYQGENRMAANNLLLGELEVEFPPDTTGIREVDIRYTYDINGILEVEVKTVGIDDVHRIVIEENPGVMSREEIERRLAGLAALKMHPRDQERNRLLLARGDRLYEERLGDEREWIGLAMQRFEAALNRQDEHEIKEEAQRLEHFLNQFERNRY
ncbi:molecular chaperone HscC [Saccharibacillus sp. CPCC 101409]|uniref:molecular chaperone HscC n=1 Tax=Saccharibacillus sp. CPCC 101409 TaxID=3058041 RepID=UPI0026720527|nr:molecular chaperone HscC [Saccharibacillus sp. CPCC 101409]MDO3411988.1 molecular chaperone HscC [Saccharibacillus sp. CPCC 101409]